MKCIKDNITGNVSRLSDDIARKRVNSGEAVYVAKHIWKKEVRDKNTPKQQISSDKKLNLSARRNAKKQNEVNNG